MGSGRDLLHKPAVPIVLPDEATGEGKVKDKLGTKVPSGRDLGGVPGEKRAPVTRPPTRPTAPGKTQAHKAAYFNKDISGVRDVNQRQGNMQALRGAQGATDLKKVVLPPAVGVDHPEPEQLRAAGDLMGLDGSLNLDLQTMLGRQGEWARGEGVTVEMLLARMAQLEAMVEARKIALERMRKAAREQSPSVTIDQANCAEGNALDEATDLVEEGRALVERTAEQAEGMHRRLAKMLGIKRSK